MRLVSMSILITMMAAPFGGAVSAAPRLGYLQPDGTFKVKEGSLVQYLASDGSFLVKEGSLTSAPWVAEANAGSGITQIALGGDRIARRLSDGRFYAKEGPLGAEWVLEAGDATQIAFSEYFGAQVKGGHDGRGTSDTGHHRRERGDAGAGSPRLHSLGRSCEAAVLLAPLMWPPDMPGLPPCDPGGHLRGAYRAGTGGPNENGEPLHGHGV